MTPAHRNLSLFGLNLAVWSLNLMMATGTLRLAAKTGIPVNVDTQPARVKLTIDGNLYKDSDISNGWVQSPGVVYLPAGQHKITLERPGYVPHTFKALTLPGGEPLEIKTQLEPFIDTTNEIEIRGEDNNTEDVIAIVDQGLEMGPMPLTTNDLTPGLHSIEIRPIGLAAFRLKPYFCSFQILQGSSSQNTFTVSKRGNKISVSGCQKIRRLP